MKASEILNEAKGKAIIAYAVRNGVQVEWLDDTQLIEKFFKPWFEHARTRYSKGYVGNPDKNFKGPIRTWLDRRGADVNENLALERVTIAKEPTPDDPAMELAFGGQTVDGIPGRVRPFVMGMIDNNMAKFPEFIKENEAYVLVIEVHFFDQIKHVIDHIDQSFAPTGTGRARYAGETPNKKLSDDVVQQKLNSQTVDRLITDAERAQRQEQKQTKKRNAQDPFTRRIDDSKGKKRPVIRTNTDGTYWVQISGLKGEQDARDEDYPELAKAIPQGKEHSMGSLNSRNPLLRREGHFMGHCIGGGGYDDTINYSLRDQDNIPHVTIQMSENKRVDQIKGRKNNAPKREYATAVLEFLNSMDIKDIYDGDFKRVGIERIGDKFMTAEMIQTALETNPDLLLKYNISRDQQRRLGLVQIGDRLVAQGNIAKMIRDGTMQPEDLNEANFDNKELMKMGLIETKDGVKRFKDLKKGEVIKGDISIEQAPYDPKIPSGIIIDGNLHLERMPVEAELIPAIKVKGDVNIKDSHYNSIAEGFECGGNVSITGTRLVNWPSSKHMTIKSLVIDGDAAVKEFANATVERSARLEGVLKVGKNTKFKDSVQFANGKLQAVDPSAQFDMSVLAADTMLREWTVKNVGGSLDLTNCTELTKIPDGLHVGTTGKEYIFSLRNTAVMEFPKNVTVNGLFFMPGDDDSEAVKLMPENLKARALAFMVGKLKYLPKGVDVHTFIAWTSAGRSVDSILFQAEPGDTEDRILLDDVGVHILATGEKHTFKELAAWND